MALANRNPSEDMQFFTLRDLESYMEEYMIRTNQMFVKGKRVDILRPSDRYYVTLRYSKITYECIHYGEPRTHRRESNPTVRPNQTSLKLGCPVCIVIKIVRADTAAWFKFVNIPGENDTPLHEGHSHEISKEMFQLYPQRRNLSEKENANVQEMLKTGVPAATIAKAVNVGRSSNNVPGRVIPKTIHNIATKTKQTMRKGKHEEEVVETVIQDLLAGDEKAIVEPVVDEDGRLVMLFIQTSDMQDMMRKYPEVIFVDGTYRINVERYCMWSVVVMDRDGFGQCAAIGFLANETADIMRSFFRTFWKHNESSELSAVFCDKDLKNIEILDEVFVSKPVLLCIFHTLKSIKTYLAQMQLSVQEKQRILTLFKKLVYSDTEHEFNQQEKDLLQQSPDDFHNYYRRNWSNCKDRWALYLRRRKRQPFSRRRKQHSSE